MEKYTVIVDSEGNTFWYKENTDILHRLDGPARIYSKGDKSWVQNGKKHRLDGPAVELADGRKEYWIKGIQYYTEAEYLKMVHSLSEKKEPDSLVSYVGNNEILVCFLSVDEEFQKKKFGTGTNRYLEDYDRCVHVELHAGFKLNVSVVSKY